MIIPQVDNLRRTCDWAHHNLNGLSCKHNDAGLTLISSMRSLRVRWISVLLTL